MDMYSVDVVQFNSSVRGLDGLTEHHVGGLGFVERLQLDQADIPLKDSLHDGPQSAYQLLFIHVLLVR